MAKAIVSKRANNFKDRIGHNYGRLTVVGGPTLRNRKTYWQCKCECGNTSMVSAANLSSGSSKSCGCLQRELLAARTKTHNGTHDSLYAVWAMMKQRCLNTNATGFRNYGGRGITICDEWHDYASFRDWAIPHGYDPRLQLDRIDNESGYCPGNCRWVHPLVNANNRRNNVVIEHGGESLTAAQWSRRLGGNKTLVSTRLKAGWSETRAVTEPVRR